MNIIVLMAGFLGFVAAALGVLMGIMMGFWGGIIGFLGGLVLMFGSVLAIGLLKSPMWTFMSAAYEGRPLIELDRKDNVKQWLRTNALIDGMMGTRDHGVFMIAPKDPGKIEKKSGVKIYRVADGVGNTISPKMQKVIKFIYNNMGISDPVQVQTILQNWNKCQEVDKKTKVACDWQGVPTKIPIIEKDEDGDDRVVGNTLHCHKCESQKLLREYPQMYTSLIETIDIDAPSELFLPSQLHPDKTDVYAHYMVKASEAASKRNYVNLMIIGMTIMLVMIGVGVMVTLVLGATGGAAAGAAGSSLVI